MQAEGERIMPIPMKRKTGYAFAYGSLAIAGIFMLLYLQPDLRPAARARALDCAALGLSALVWLSLEWLFGWGVSACFFDVLTPPFYGGGVFFLSQTGEKLSPPCG